MVDKIKNLDEVNALKISPERKLFSAEHGEIIRGRDNGRLFRSHPGNPPGEKISGYGGYGGGLRQGSRDYGRDCRSDGPARQLPGRGLGFA